MALPSRQYSDPQRFVEDFLQSLTPGVIPRSEFINWHTIEAKLTALSPGAMFFTHIRNRARQEAVIQREITDSLLASDNPLPYLRCALELLGHTSDQLVTRQDDVNINLVCEAIRRGDESKADEFVTMLAELGLVKVLRRDDLEDVLLGIQIGLETHRRKNVGGSRFRKDVKGLLGDVVTRLSNQTAKKFSLVEERTIRYGSGLAKQVDFAILVEEKVHMAFEANFYTVTGSKPTEIKRSYGDVVRGLSENNVDLIWITDGNGYKDMKRSLRDAYVILPNIYSLNQAREHLHGDLVSTL